MKNIFFYFIIICFTTFCMYCNAQNPLQANATQSTKQVNVVLTQPWTRTGVNFTKGQKITVSATGTLHWFSPAHPNYTSTPDGQVCNFPGFAVPGLKCWSLIGKIGNSPIFQVGSNYNDIANATGELLLGVNDNNYSDNAGNWTATIAVSAPLPPEPTQCGSKNENCPELGDLVVYWNGSEYNHVGVVIDIGVDGSGKVLRIRSKWAAGAVYDHDPNVGPYGKNWSVWRRNMKPNTNDLDKINWLSVINNQDLITDKKNIIRHWTGNKDNNPTSFISEHPFEGVNRVPQYYPNGKNDDEIKKELLKYDCRGFIFGHMQCVITDGDRPFSISQVKTILNDNYYSIKAKDITGNPH